MTRALVLRLTLCGFLVPLAQAAWAGTVYQLTQAQIDSIVPAPAIVLDRSVIPIVEAPSRRDRGVHGEVGTEFGTHGTRSVFGSAMVPIGDNAFAAFSFEDSTYGGYGNGRYHR